MPQTLFERSPVLFALGFRPFFLMAIPAALVLVAWWTAAYGSGLPTSLYYGPVGWHSHEMLFGFTYAVIAGFLLTAVKNWTGLPTLHGPALAILAFLWLGARLFAIMPVSGFWIAALDLSFPIFLALAVSRPIIRARMARNMAFPFMLLLMALANLLVHLELLGLTSDTARKGTYLMIYLVLLMIVIIFGRVFPFFSSRVLPDSPIRKRKWLEVASIAIIPAIALADLFQPFYLSRLCILGALLHGLRLLFFHPRGLWSVPLLWVLYVGYAWLPLGFALKAASLWGHANPFLALHALTAGCIGVLTLGMMARVALGHTGRKLDPPGLITAAFIIVNLAVLARVLMPLFLPAYYMRWVHVSGGLWSLAFLLMLVVFAPILISPRPDGKPG